MAYDAMGNYTGYDDAQDTETEEQRRRRLAAEQANAVVHTTQIKTYGDGTQEETTKRTLTAPGPVSPDQVFQRQIQAESGGQHYAPGGGILTSPAGAQGIAQVMPATAAAPGYGIQPATPQEIATPEGNRAFGERYKQGMLSLFGGDQQKATAAYNAGPGRIQQAEAQAAQQGGSWTDYIPKETMGYLGKVFGGMIPSAAAAELPKERPLPPGIVREPDGTLRMTSMPGQAPAAAPAAPAAAEEPAASPYALTAPSGQGLQVPGVPTAVASEANPYIKKYQESQDDIKSLLPLAQDPAAPEWLRNRASERAAELNRNQIEEQRAKEQLANMSPNQVASELRKKGEEGSWIKAILFGVLGMENSQKEEAAKLGIGKWEDSVLYGPNGEMTAVQLKRAPNGRILSGTTMDGRDLTTEEINMAKTGNVENIKTLQTQAHHSAATTMDQMRKANMERQDKRLPPMYTEEQIQQRGREVYNQTMSVSRGGTRMAGITGLPTAAAAAGAPGAAAPAAEAGIPTTQYKTSTGKPSTVFANWDQQRVGEGTKDYGKRMEIRPEDVEETAQALAKGQIKPSELTGRQNDFRRVAIQRALEINPNYTPQTYQQVEAVLKRYTSGKDHDTLVNTGTAVNHLMQYKDIAAATPGNTDISSWNTFYQNLMKYGNAPEIKSKEQMAGFVAGELVKAASGGQGSMTERIHQEQQLMKANTPAEVQMIIDNAIKLAHGRYSSMRSSFKGSTGRSDQEFADLAGLPDEARRAFDKIDASHAIKDQGTAAEKWAREHPNDPRSAEILKRLGKQ